VSFLGQLDGCQAASYDEGMTTTTLLSTRELLDTVPIRESALRSLIRRKFVLPTRHGGFYWWDSQAVERVQGYLNELSQAHDLCWKA